MAVAAVAVLAIGLYAMFGPAPRVPLGMLTATADERAASGYRQEGKVSANPAIVATSTKLESSCNVSASSSTVSSGGSRLFAGTLAIYNLRDDLLMQRLGLALFEQLRDDGLFQQVRYLPAGKHLPEGERLPELFLTLDRRSWEESGHLARRQFKAKLVVTMSDQFRRSSHSYSTNLSPPQLEFRWRAEIDYTAKQTGIETSGARYKAVSNDIAKQIVEQLTKRLDEMRTQHGTAGQVPDQFYPEYVAPPVFEFVDELGAEKLVDGSRLMTRTIAIWQTAGNQAPQEVIAAVSRSLSKAGWNVPETGKEDEYLRAAQGEQVVVVFREDDGRLGIREEADSRPRMFITYTRTLTEDEVHAAVEKAFEDGVDESVLVMFQNFWYRHPEVIEKYFREHAPSQSDSWLQLARLRKRSQPEAAREALLRANALRLIVEQESPDSSMKKLAEELEMEELPRQVSHEMVKSLGLGELPEPGEIELRLHVNQLAAIWLGNSEDGQRWLLLTPIRRHGDMKTQLRIQVLTLGDHNWSRSEQMGGDLKQTEHPVLTQYLDGEQLKAFSEPADDGKSYRLTLRRSEKEPPIRGR